MDSISEGETSKEAVVDRSKEVLRKVYGELESVQDEFADVVRAGIREDSVLGPCKKCGLNLTVRRAKKSGKRFAGCEGYPDCDQTYSLPPRGEIIPLGTLCEACGSPEIKVVGGRRPWITCIDMSCPKKQEEREKARARKEAGTEAESGKSDKDAESGDGAAEDGSSGNGQAREKELEGSTT
jgi:DNA topoisomerase-1